jgi:hypothetical protein
MAVQLPGQQQFGANAIGAGNQQWLLPALQVEFEQRSETTQAVQYFGPHGFPHRWFDAFNEFGAGIDVYTSVTIGKARGVARGASIQGGIRGFNKVMVNWLQGIPDSDRAS